MTEDLIAALRKAAGDKGYLEGDEIGERYVSDWIGAGDSPPDLVLRPATTEQLSEIMRLCHTADQPVVTQGGMTGLVEGARPRAGEIVISLERMNAIENLDEKSGTMTVQAGVPLQTVQEHADAHGWLYPLDLGARGSCTIGGNLSTNAGGNRVIRYGMTRDLVLGIEAVLADGTIINSLNRLIKNNTGYDLKQLFIGSEGTLGIVTRAVLRLSAKPRSQNVAFCAAPDFGSVVELMGHLKSGLGSTLSAFEVLWPSTYQLTIDTVPGLKAPLPKNDHFYVLAEAMGADPTRDRELFDAVLGEALEKGHILDAVIAKSKTEITELWDIRDGMAEAMGNQRPAVGFDVSLAVGDMEAFTEQCASRAARTWNDASVWVGGHLGDGNLHLMVKAGDRSPQPTDEINGIVYGLVGEMGGSVSAEHGIGILKRPYLGNSRSPEELALMRSIKQTMDPKNLLNRGRILAPA